MATDTLLSCKKASPAVIGCDGTVLPAPPSWSHALPRETCPHVLRFCGELHPTNKPVMVPVRPHLLYGYGVSPIGRCYEGVADYQKRVGGTFQHGWMLWETEGIYLRAFHHCVHRDGRLLTDVSPQPHRHILFLPTSVPGVLDEAYQEGIQQVDSHGVKSRYFPLSDSPMVRRIISLHQAKDGHEQYSTEWDRLLEEAWSLEQEYHELSEARSASSKRRRFLKPKLRIGR